MIKSIIKEIFIIILLVIAILLILGIMFYESRPSTFKIPTSVEAYVLPEDMQEELNETITKAETQNIVKTYKVNSEDLKGYEKSDDYVPGRINPFDKISSTANGQNQENTNSENNSNGTSQNGTGTQGNFLNTVK